jgi:predicted DNA-binding protein (MmcQ/YjbR family)
MTAAALRRFCLAQAGAEETFPFGPETSVFKVGGKMFAVVALKTKPLRVTLKCEPELSIELRSTHEEITPGYHANKRHWITLDLTGSLEDALIRDLVGGSYDLVAPKT